MSGALGSAVRVRRCAGERRMCGVGVSIGSDGDHPPAGAGPRSFDLIGSIVTLPTTPTTRTSVPLFDDEE
jgi:hypothetical protein